MKKPTILQTAEMIALPLQAISPAPRAAILVAIGRGEACVCHLEAALGWRQAYISQHLMALRQAGVLSDRREGRYVYYRLTNIGYLDLLIAAGVLGGVPAEAIHKLIHTDAYPACPCPHCTPALIPVESLQTR